MRRVAAFRRLSFSLQLSLPPAPSLAALTTFSPRLFTRRPHLQTLQVKNLIHTEHSIIRCSVNTVSEKSK